MLIDSHVHLWTKENLPDANRWVYANMWAWYRGFEFTGTRRRFLPPVDKRGPWRDPKSVMHRVGAITWDPEGTDLLAHMDRNGIDKVINMVVDWGLAWGNESEWNVWEVNRHACSFKDKYPGRYYCSVGVDPRRYNAVEVLEKVVKEWGAICIKIMPANGVAPDDHVCYPLYEACRALRIPVVIHTGTGDLASFVSESHPYHVQNPAKDFPDVQFVIAHCGGGLDGLWREVLMMIQFIPNIAVDLAEWQYPISPSHLDPGREQEFIHVLNILRRNLGSHNIMMGTDYMKGHRPENDTFWIDLFKDLPARAKKFGYNFSEDEAQMYRCDNARRIYGI